MITLRLDKNGGINKGDVQAFEHDNLSEVYIIQLYKNGAIYDLTNKIVELTMVERKRKIGDMVSLPIYNATEGKIKLEVVSEITKQDGIYDFKLTVKDTTGLIETFPNFQVGIKNDITDSITGEIIQDPNFTILTDGLKALADYNIYKTNALKVPEIEQDIVEINEQLEHITLDVTKLGVDNTGVTPISDDFMNAINYAKNKGLKVLKASGIFKVDKEIRLESDLYYDFTNAEFIGSDLVDGLYIFYAENKKNIRINGGKYYLKDYSPQRFDINGIYSTFIVAKFQRCNNINVSNCKIYNMFNGIDFYNSTNCTVINCYTEDCKSSFSAVSETNGLCENIRFNQNTIIRGGDDGIVFVSYGENGRVINSEACNNLITKSTRINNELNGSTTAGVGIRIGNFLGSTATHKNITLSNNKYVDMVGHAIHISFCESVTIIGEIIDGYAKDYNNGSAAVQIGETDYKASHVIVSNCIIKNNKTNMPVIKLVDSSDINIYNNDFSEVNCFPKLIRLGTYDNHYIQNNDGLKTYNTGIHTFPYTQSVELVAHGLDDINNCIIELIPMFNLGNTQKYWVDEISASAFRINLDQITGGTTNPVFRWKATSNKNKDIIT